MIVFSKLNKFYLLTAILSVAAIVRFHQIDQPFIDCVNWRETDTASIADNFYRGNWNIFYPAISWNGPEPNYVGYEFQTVTYIAALVYRLVGQHDWVGRTVAVLFGLWSIFAFYQLVRRVWDEERAIAPCRNSSNFPRKYLRRSVFSSRPCYGFASSDQLLAASCLSTNRTHIFFITGKPNRDVGLFN